eukprot:205693_1
MSQWNDVCKKAEDLLSQTTRTSAFAKYVPNLNEYYEIKYGKAISKYHLLAILLCNDSIQLFSKTRTVCILDNKETISDLKNKHSQYVNWFRLLGEVITFYGNNLSRKDHTVYHFLTTKSYFDNFKVSYNFPLAAASNLCWNKSFTKWWHNIGIRRIAILY